jgi:hypothetical protein
MGASKPYSLDRVKPPPKRYLQERTCLGVFDLQRGILFAFIVNFLTGIYGIQKGGWNMAQKPVFYQRIPSILLVVVSLFCCVVSVYGFQRALDRDLQLFKTRFLPAFWVVHAFYYALHLSVQGFLDTFDHLLWIGLMTACTWHYYKALHEHGERVQQDASPV